MFIRIEDGKPVGHPIMDNNFRLLFPSTSFPTYPTPSDVEPFGFGLYEFSAVPETGDFEKAVEDVPVLNASGTWMQKWKIVPVDDLEREEILKRLTLSARNERDTRLRLCDWTQLQDAPISEDQKQAWAQYRQQLRAVPEQEQFPLNIQWPAEPQE